MVRFGLRRRYSCYLDHWFPRGPTDGLFPQMESYLPNIRPCVPGGDEISAWNEAKCFVGTNLKNVMPFWCRETPVLRLNSEQDRVPQVQGNRMNAYRSEEHT